MNEKCKGHVSSFEIFGLTLQVVEKKNRMFLHDFAMLRFLSKLWMGISHRQVTFTLNIIQFS